MKFLLGFLLGVLVATAAQLYAQSGGGFFTDQNGSIGQFYQYPGGAIDYWTPNGQRGTIYQMPGTQFGIQKSPC